MKIKQRVKIIALLLIITACICIAGLVTSRYKRTASVSAVDGNFVYCVENGNTWKFFDCHNHYHKDQKLVLLMYTNGTDDVVWDDIILEVNGNAVEDGGYAG